MLGWEIFVMRQDNPAPDGGQGDGTLVAAWLTGMSGTKWLDALAAANRATDLGGNGYPCRWLVPAGEVQNALVNGAPAGGGPITIGDDYVIEGTWAKVKVLRRELLNAMPLDEVLVVEGWDQS